MEDQGFAVLRTAAHDLKNPLTTIKAIGQILKLSLDRGVLTSEPDRLARNLNMLIAQVDRLSDLSNILIDASRAQSGRFKMDRQAGDLSFILKSALLKYADRAITLDVPVDPVLGQWDKVYLGQAVAYLLNRTQAAKVRLERCGEQARVVIEGDPGSAASDDPHAYIAEKIIEAHGGKLSDHWVIELPM